MRGKKKIDGIFWTNYSFLDDEYIDKVLNYSQKHSLIEIEQKDTHYEAYADSLRYKPEFTTPIISKLNEQYKILFNKQSQTIGLSSLQFVKKRFVPNKSFL